jgi:hypothetical protein
MKMLKPLLLAALFALGSSTPASAQESGVPQLLRNSTTTGAAQNWLGGVGMFMAVSTGWNGATAALQILGPDGTTWLDAGGNTTFVANNLGIFYLPPCRIRVVIRTAVPSAGVYAEADRVGNNP